MATALSIPAADVEGLDGSCREEWVRPSLESLSLAVEAYRERRHRDRFFPLGTFVEPTWDILLDLFTREAEGRVTTVTSACIAARVPATTGLRYIAALTEAKLVRRVPNPWDSRSSLLELTPAAAAMMSGYLAHVAARRASASLPSPAAGSR